MCLVLFSYKTTPGHKLVLGANRDEFLERPTLALDYFDVGKTILAGRDLRGGGTWLGVNIFGKIAAITNYRDPVFNTRSGLSRGLIIRDYLESRESPKSFLLKLAQNGDNYNGFNLLAGDMKELLYYSNASGEIKRLVPGLYGLSNHLLDTAWPKVARGKEKLRNVLSQSKSEMIPAIFSLLEDTVRPKDIELPETGVGVEWERLLSTIFISAPTYGTRSSAALSVTENNEVTFVERTFTHSPTRAAESGRKEFHLHFEQNTPI